MGKRLRKITPLSKMELHSYTILLTNTLHQKYFSFLWTEGIGHESIKYPIQKVNVIKRFKHLAWNTVRHDWPKLLKVLRSASSPVANRPPKICIPNSAKMKMKRMRRTKSALMEAIELTRLLTRLPILAQYLEMCE